MSQPAFSRRSFLTQTAGAATLVVASSVKNPLAAETAAPLENTLVPNGASVAGATFAMDQTRVRFYIPGLEKASKIMIVSDTHLSIDDERGEPFKQYTGRMGAAYKTTRHFQTGQPTEPKTCFLETLKLAQKQRVDKILLLGDTVSIPSAAGVEWVLEQLNACSIPFHYISGNHDWHFEGMDGTSQQLRAEWAPKRLGPLYQGANPLGYGVDLNGIRLLLIDDSIYEILPEQLELLKTELALGQPTVLFSHIPLYAPGRSIGYGCGHPDWGAKSDPAWQIERRPRWRETGHTQTTFGFWRTALEAPNLLGAFAGHVHVQTLDIVAGKPLVAVEANACGGYMTVEFLPR